MALTAVAMDCGTGVKFPGTTLLCSAIAYTVVGTDARWRGPKFSIFFRFRLTSTSFTVGSAVVGCSETSAGFAAQRFALLITVDGSNLKLQGRIDTTACGDSLTTFHTVAKDTQEHSVAWTYDQASTYAAYWDGALVSSGAVPCSDIANPAAAGDVFIIIGNSGLDGGDLFNIDRVMYSDAIASSSQIVDMDASCAAF